MVGGHQYRAFDPIVKNLKKVGGFDFILGLDVLRQSNMTIDYVAKKLVFAFLDQQGARVRFHPQAALIMVPVEVCSGTVRLMLDTGAEETALYDLQERSEVSECLVRRPVVHYLSFYYGKVKGREVLCPTLKIKDLSWHSQKAVLMSRKHHDTAPGQGILSPVNLGIRQLAFDFTQGVVSFAR